MLLAVALCLLCTLHDSQADAGGPPGRRLPPPPHAVAEVRAVRVAQAIAVDGMLEEPVWRQAIGVSHFTQSDPIEGAQPSESTVVYVAYDDAALYVAARLYDAHPDSIVARLGRRDAELNADRFIVYVDSYHDRRSGFYFGVNAAGAVSDGTLYNDDWDDNSWDGVWEGKAHIDGLGWTVEMRIPYSQLRFRAAEHRVWGINFRREIARRNEIDYLVLRPKSASGFVSRFADLAGIDGITPPRRLEMLPYATSKVERAPLVAGDPFHRGAQYSPGAGADLKVGIGSNLTLSGTINPDFGQVEVDPAVPEGNDSDSSFADVPAGAHILGALKVTGKARGSWNVGALSAVTARALAEVDTSGIRFTKEVEPLAYYGVFRAQKEFPEGRQGWGFMATVAARSFQDPTLRDDVNSSALVLWTDVWTFLDHLAHRVGHAGHAEQAEGRLVRELCRGGHRPAVRQQRRRLPVAHRAHQHACGRGP